MYTRVIRHLAPFVLLLIVCVYPFTTFAGTGLSIQPVKISETLNPGETVTGTILLSNAGDGAIDVSVSTQDFVPVAGAETIQFVGTAPGVTSVKDWITVGAKNTFSFEKGESREIPYTITAPKNAEPGGHFGVVLFKATKKDSGESLKIGTQVGMLVLVAIPGSHLQKGNILDFTTQKFIQRGPVHFGIKFENTGTVHFEPKGDIVIKNIFGTIVGTVPVEGQIVLPTSVKTLTEDWHTNNWLLGRYTAQAVIRDGDGNVLTTDTVSFWAFPVWYTLSFILTLILIFAAIRFIKKRVRISLVS